MAKEKYFGSIESLYVRDRTTNLLVFGGPLRDETWNHVKRWRFSEKVDGANASFVITSEDVTFRGRTSAAEFKQSAIDGARAALPSHEALVEFFSLTESSLPITIFGELYGAGIQKMGGLYRPTPSFRAFDMKFGEVWRDDTEFRGIAAELGIPVVPHVGEYEMPNSFDKAFMDEVIPESIVAIEDSGTYGVTPEGIVARPPVALFDKYGQRVMFKITNREYKAA